MRYDQLLVLIALHRPKTIVDIGTNNGERGIAMCQEALKYTTNVSYVGFDVFDTKDEEFHSLVFNGKGFFAKEVVARRFNNLAEQHTGFRFELIEGTTQETLHGTRVEADFVFIDGDHRVEVIRRDYDAVKRSRVVVFDDYYLNVPGCTQIDTAILGCNRLVDKLRGHCILPMADRFPHVGEIRMAVKFRGRFGFGFK